MLPRLVALTVSAACGLAVGCGGESDAEDVEEVVRAFSISILNGDGEEACAQMTDAGASTYVADMSDAFQSITGEPGSFSCSEAVAFAAAMNRGAGPADGEPEKEAAARAKAAVADSAVETLQSGEGIGAIDVIGDRATATEIAGLGDGTSLTLERTEDGWLLSGFE